MRVAYILHVKSVDVRCKKRRCASHISYMFEEHIVDVQCKKRRCLMQVCVWLKSENGHGHNCDHVTAEGGNKQKKTYT